MSRSAIPSPAAARGPVTRGLVERARNARALVSREVATPVVALFAAAIMVTTGVAALMQPEAVPPARVGVTAPPQIAVATVEEMAALFRVKGHALQPPAPRRSESARAADSASPAPASTEASATPAVWVPRVLLATLPGDLAAVTPADRKALFVQAVLPLVLTVNEEIAATRAQLVAIDTAHAAGAAPTGEQADWLAAVARDYGVEITGDLGADLRALLVRVDVIPPSLALAQAALESGWGTSRFARQGNALFGERTWGENGLRELGAGPEARHRARSFTRLLDGVDSYMRNLNTHRAYAEFRRARAALREAGEAPAGLELVGHLTRYSELGKAYTKQVRGLIRSNGFAALDAAELQPAGSADPTI